MSYLRMVEDIVDRIAVDVDVVDCILEGFNEALVVDFSIVA